MKKNLDKIVLGTIILVILLIRIFVFKPVRVNGTSMEPTLKNGELLLLNKVDKTYNRFNIIVFKYNKQKFVKRIIGLPGEKVECKDNHIYINNEFVYENFYHGETKDFSYKFKIPKGYYFVLGDNRPNSFDSRNIGLVKEKDIVGVVNISLLPLRKVSRASIDGE